MTKTLGRFFKVQNGQLFFDDTDLGALAKKISTPFFLFSQGSLEENYRDFWSNFSSGWKDLRVYYSVKTNFELSVLKTLAHLGSCAGVSCGHELYLALKAGINPDKICFDGPCKTREDLEFAIKKNIYIFNAESSEEARELNNLARKYRQKVNLGFRVDPSLNNFRTSLVEKFIHKFGIAENKAVETYLRARELKNINLIGIHAHIGSQNTSTYPYLAAIKSFSRINKELAQNGILLKEFNLGGGFPSGTLKKTTLTSLVLNQLGIELPQKIPSLKDFGESITLEFKKQIGNGLLAFEPGRSINSSCGVVLTRVKRIKDSWIFLDTTMRSLPESLFFSQKEILPVVTEAKGAMAYNISGASLSTADVFYLRKKLPRVKIGDLLVILDAGAYSISMAVPFTVSNPPVYWIPKKGGVRLVRRKSSFRDIVAPMLKF